MLIFCRLTVMHLSTIKYLFQLLRPPYLSLLFLRTPQCGFEIKAIAGMESSSLTTLELI